MLVKFDSLFSEIGLGKFEANKSSILPFGACFKHGSGISSQMLFVTDKVTDN